MGKNNVKLADESQNGMKPPKKKMSGKIIAAIAVIATAVVAAVATTIVVITVSQNQVVQKQELKAKMESVTVDYDGLEHSISATNIPNGVTASYTITDENGNVTQGNSVTNAGTYTVTATFTDTTDVYDVSQTKTATLTINKKAIDNVHFDTTSIYFDSTAHSFKIAEELPADVTVTYIIKDEAGNVVEEAINPGIYTVTAHFSSTSGNYSLPADITSEISILPTTFNVTMSNSEVIYDGNTHGIEINEELPDDISVTYSIQKNGENVTAGNEATNAGTYTVTVHFSSENTHYTLPADISATLTIKKEILALTILGGTKTYNGEPFESEISQNDMPEGVEAQYYVDGVSVGRISITNAGTYTISATFTDSTGNYDISNSSAKVTILKANYDLTSFRFDSTSIVYDGQTHKLEITGTVPEGLTPVYTDNELTNVGSIDVELTFTGDFTNYFEIEKQTSTLTITAAKVTKPLADTTVFNYTGTEQTYNIAESTLYTVTGNKQTALGTHTVTVALKDKTNYTWADGTTADLTFDFVINKATVQIPTADQTAFKYNGQAQTYTIASNSLYTVTGNEATNAGTYTVTVALNDTTNYVWSDQTSEAKTYSFVIAKADFNVVAFANTFNNKSVAYSGDVVTAPQGDSSLLPTGVTVSYKAYDEKDNTEVAIDNISAIGRYKIVATFTVAESLVANYNTPDSITKILAIGKADHIEGLVFEGLEIEYDGNAHLIAVNPSTLPTGITVAYTISKNGGAEAEGNSAITIGTYTVKAIFTDTTGYYEVEPMTQTLTITKRNVDEPAQDTETYTYNGYEQNYNIPVSSLYTVTNDEHIDAGTYTVTVALNDKENYQWKTSKTTNDLTYQFTIGKATYDLESITYGNKQIGYGETLPTVDGTLPDGVVATYSYEGVTGVPTAVGNYNVTITFSSANNNYKPITKTLTGTLEITKLNVNMSGVVFEGDTVTYDGESHSISIDTATLPGAITAVSYTIQKTGEAAVTGNSAMAVGNYLITASFTVDTAIYNTPDNKTATLIIKSISNYFEMKDSSVNYDGESHSIVAICGASTTVPEGVTITYTIMEKTGGTPTEGNSATRAGVYTVTANITDSTGNYVTTDDHKASLAATLTITKTNKFDITFDYGNSTIKMYYAVESNQKLSTILASDYVQTNMTIPGKDGYNRTWSTSSSAALDTTLKLTGDITFVIYEEPIKYSITYHNLSNVSNSQLFIKEYTIETSTFEVPTVEYSTHGYVFGGWYSNSGMTLSVSSITKGSTGNIDLYLKTVEARVTSTKNVFVIESDTYDITYTINKTSTISYETTSVDLKSYITVNEGSTYVLYSEQACTNTIANSIMPIVVGENTAYLKVTNGSSSYVYKVVITKSQLYKLTYTYDASPIGDNYELNEIVTLPSTNPSGRTFLGYSTSSGGSVNITDCDTTQEGFQYKVIGDATIYAIFAATTRDIKFYLDNTSETPLETLQVAYGDKYTLYKYENAGQAAIKWTDGTTEYDDFTTNKYTLATNADVNLYAVMDSASSQFASTITDSKATINGYKAGAQEAENLVIPSYVFNANKYYQVTGINDSAFSGKTAIKSVSIPEGVTIGKYAFNGCTGITAKQNGGLYATYGSSKALVAVEAGATSITITDDNITYIAEDLLSGATSLTTINLNLSSVPTYFDNKLSYLSSTSMSKLVNLNVTNAYPKLDINTIENVVFADSITVVANSLSGLTGIKSLTLGSVTTLSSYFGTVPSTLKTVVVNTSVSPSAFASCASLTTITLPENITIIPNKLFDGCTSLVTVNNISNVVTVGDYGFRNCKLLNVTLPTNITSIGTAAFQNCEAITSIDISKATSYGSGAINGMIGLESITVANLGGSATALSTLIGTTSALKTVNITTSLGNNALKNMTSITSVTMSNSITSIGDSAFYGCSNLSSITLSNSISSIGTAAFYGTAITEITLPATLETVGSSAFSGLTLSKVNYSGTVGQWAQINFADASANPAKISNLYINGSLLDKVVIPNDVTSIGSYAFYYFDTTIYVANQLTSVGEGAVTNVTNIYYGGSATNMVSKIPNMNDAIYKYTKVDCVHENDAYYYTILDDDGKRITGEINDVQVILDAIASNKIVTTVSCDKSQSNIETISECQKHVYYHCNYEADGTYTIDGGEMFVHDYGTETEEAFLNNLESNSSNLVNMYDMTYLNCENGGNVYAYCIHGDSENEDYISPTAIKIKAIGHNFGSDGKCTRPWCSDKYTISATNGTYISYSDSNVSINLNGENGIRSQVLIYVVNSENIIEINESQDKYILANGTVYDFNKDSDGYEANKANGYQYYIIWNDSESNSYYAYSKDNNRYYSYGTNEYYYDGSTLYKLGETVNDSLTISASHNSVIKFTVNTTGYFTIAGATVSGDTTTLNGKIISNDGLTYEITNVTSVTINLTVDAKNIPSELSLIINEIKYKFTASGSGGESGGGGGSGEGGGEDPTPSSEKIATYNKDDEWYEYIDENENNYIISEEDTPAKDECTSKSHHFVVTIDESGIATFKCSKCEQTHTNIESA